MNKQFIKNITRKFGVEILGYENKVITLKPSKKIIGNVLLSYTVNPFLLKIEQSFNNAHTCDWECYHIAKTFLDLGYLVDVIKYTNDNFIPKKEYSFFIDELTNMERITPLLNNDCIKILHCVWAHWLFHNTAQYQRCFYLRERKGIALKPQRLLKPNSGIETADCATILGNKFTIGTYEFAQKPIYRVPLSTQILFPWPEDKNFDRCRKNFLWFGSGGLIHKGLDLVLDAFSQMPEYHLTICGPISQEKDFELAYYKELYQTTNIHTIGWIDIQSKKFTDITNNCIGLIYPSCSEGGGGSVINCMHAALIPLVSYESSVDITEDYGVIFKECTVEEIKRNIVQISNLSTNNLKQMAKNAWDFARANFARDIFLDQYQKTIQKIIDNHRKIDESNS